MIDKRLIELLGSSKWFIYANVMCQWGMLLCSIVATSLIGLLISDLLENATTRILPVVLAVAGTVAARHLLTIKTAEMSFMASRDVKKTLRGLIYDKLLRLGVSYHEKISTAEAVQLTTEGVEQLETYYSAFLPQFFYSMLAPVTLFAFLAFIHLPTALVLLAIVPLIPIAIAAVQKIAKKLLSKYWGQYAKLGSSFLENLQGMTTLKIYQADGFKAEKMAEEAEGFRKITMKVLTMQLNSITVMDIIAYGGAAVGLIFSVLAYTEGLITFWGCFVMIMLAAEFFLPLRALGSYFHTAMNGVAASARMFRLMDMDEPDERRVSVGEDKTMTLANLSFSYDDKRQVLDNISMNIPQGSFTAVVGESGSGKSTIASILTGRSTGYSGTATLGGAKIGEIVECDMMRTITYVGHGSYLFKGTVAENLRLGRPSATDDELWTALRQIRIDDFFRSQQGLETFVEENGANLSGGQRQRLALARALLHDTPIYIFDEATSNIDVESEAGILATIHDIAEKKTVIMITHRLLNAVSADRIYVVEDGKIAGTGSHEQLLAECAAYKLLWDRQQELEHYGRAGV